MGATRGGHQLGSYEEAKGLSKEGLRAKGGEEEGWEGENWRIQVKFFHSRYFMCVRSESGCNIAATFTF